MKSHCMLGNPMLRVNYRKNFGQLWGLLRGESQKSVPATHLLWQLIVLVSKESNTFHSLIPSFMWFIYMVYSFLSHWSFCIGIFDWILFIIFSCPIQVSSPAQRIFGTANRFLLLSVQNQYFDRLFCAPVLVNNKKYKIKSRTYHILNDSTGFSIRILICYLC